MVRMLNPELKILFSTFSVEQYRAEPNRVMTHKWDKCEKFKYPLKSA